MPTGKLLPRALVCFALATSGCSLLAPEEPVAAVWETALPLEIAGALGAHAARAAFPGASERPGDAEAPVQVEGPTRWSLELTTDPRRGEGCLANARIAAPRWSPPDGASLTSPKPILAERGPRRVHGTSLALLTFDAGPTGTTVGLAGSGRVAIEIRDALEATLAFADMLTAVRRDTRAQSVEERIAALRRALGSAGDPVARVPRALRAALHFEIARLLLDAEELGAARTELACALELDTANPGGIAQLATLDARLARAGEARAGSRRLAPLAGAPLLAARAQAILRAEVTLLAPGALASASRERARAYLATGDADAAARWFARAASEDVDLGPRDLIADLLGDRIPARGLYERRLAEIARLGRTEDRVLALGEACLGRGDALLALHTVARHGDQQADRHTALLRAILREVATPSLADAVRAQTRGALFEGVPGAFAAPPK